MSYPNFKDKYKGTPFITPDSDGFNRKKYLGKIPNKCLFVFQDTALDYFKKKFKGKYKKLDVKFSWACELYVTKNFCLVFNDALGAPHAAFVMEELIILGINEFIIFGIAGGLNKPGFYLCEKSITDDGVSQHYIKQTKYAYPDKELTKKLEEVLIKNNINYKKVTNWTLATFFMETKEEVVQYRKEGVETVEMEAAALFNIANLKKCKAAAVFVTSDILSISGKWENVKWKPLLEKLTDIITNMY